MCLALPGRIMERYEGLSELPFAKVAFGVAVEEVCLAYTPEAEVDDYVIVHAGFAIQTLDERAAQDILKTLQAGDPEGGA